MVFSPPLRRKRGREKDLRGTPPEPPEGNRGSLHLPVRMDNCLSLSPRVKHIGGCQGGEAPLAGVWGYPPASKSPPRMGDTGG
jgi:hypothetical protein